MFATWRGNVLRAATGGPVLASVLATEMLGEVSAGTRLHTLAPSEPAGTEGIACVEAAGSIPRSGADGAVTTVSWIIALRAAGVALG